MLSDPDRTIAKIAAGQGGHATRAQLLKHGFLPHTIQARINRGTLIQAFQGVYAVGFQASHPQARAWAALLAVGNGSALCGRSAAYLLGVTPTWREPVELIVAIRGPRTRPGVKVRRSVNLLHRDLGVVRGLPVTSPARTALDMVGRLNQKQQVRMINELRMEHRLTLEQLEDVVRRNRRHRGAALLAQLTGAGQKQPTRSQLEDAFLSMLTRYRLPIPLMNELVAGYRVDAVFPEQRLVVELDGWATHGWKRAFEEDRRRMTDVMAKTGLPTVRFTYDQTTRRQRESATQLAAILQRRSAVA